MSKRGLLVGAMISESSASGGIKHGAGSEARRVARQPTNHGALPAGDLLGNAGSAFGPGLLGGRLFLTISDICDRLCLVKSTAAPKSPESMSKAGGKDVERVSCVVTPCRKPLTASE
jgi:hypothetical protein